MRLHTPAPLPAAETVGRGQGEHAQNEICALSKTHTIPHLRTSLQFLLAVATGSLLTIAAQSFTENKNEANPYEGATGNRANDTPPQGLGLDEAAPSRSDNKAEFLQEQMDRTRDLVGKALNGNIFRKAQSHLAELVKLRSKILASVDDAALRDSLDQTVRELCSSIAEANDRRQQSLMDSWEKSLTDWENNPDSPYDEIEQTLETFRAESSSPAGLPRECP